jgi:hypothetical protein
MTTQFEAQHGGFRGARYQVRFHFLAGSNVDALLEIVSAAGREVVHTAINTDRDVLDEEEEY